MKHSPVLHIPGLGLFPLHLLSSALGPILADLLSELQFCSGLCQILLQLLVLRFQFLYFKSIVFTERSYGDTFSLIQREGLKSKLLICKTP